MGKTFAIQKKKLYEEVMEQISRLIKSEGYKAGDRLPSMNELSNVFQVGKPTAREALSVLASAGVIEIRHGSGIYVRKFGDDVSEVTSNLEKFEGEKLIYWMEYRRAVEVEAAGLAALRRTDSDIQAIEEALHNLAQETKAEKVGSFWEHEFHHRIALAAHNPIFAQAITASEEILQKYFQLSKQQGFDYSTRAEVVALEHKKIVDAITKGDASEAKRAMLEHLESVQNRARFFEK